MIKNLLHIDFSRIGSLALLILSVTLLAVWVSSIGTSAGRTIQELKIDITSADGVRKMLSKDDIKRLLEDSLSYRLHLTPISKIDLNEAETLIRRDSRVYETEIYLDAQFVLHVDVVQRRPIVRVKTDTGDDYYLDQEGQFVAVSDYRAVRVPLATGKIESYFQDWSTEYESNLNRAFRIAKAIEEDEFLTSLIEQIHFQNTKRIVMIPKVGKAKIILDYTEELDHKLENLKSFYKRMAKTKSWNKYAEIDISYKNQVVPRNPVKP